MKLSSSLRLTILFIYAFAPLLMGASALDGSGGCAPNSSNGTSYKLDVSITGTGSGTVTSDPEGISCASDCSEDYDQDTLVTLTASADTGSTFTGWSGGGCSGTGTCTVTMTAAATVTATFNLDDKTLSVTFIGDGTGTITSDPAGISCTSDCSHDFATGTLVTLTATADADSTFTGWSEATCPGTDPCTVTMDAAKTVTAQFTLGNNTLSVSFPGTGGGTVTSDPAGISCTSDCSHDFTIGTPVTLTATANGSSTFAGWSGGGCSGTAPCTVTMDSAKLVTATFTLNTYALTVTRSGAGNGSVTSAPAGINCGATCSADYTSGTPVTLTASPTSGSTFAGWSGGGCAGTGTCLVTMTAATSVTATFTVTNYTLNVTLAGIGSGSVTSVPAGISCGATCSADYASGTPVTLTATPDTLSVFLGWSGGGCAGTGTCMVTMSAATSVTATFDGP